MPILNTSYEINIYVLTDGKYGVAMFATSRAYAIKRFKSIPWVTKYFKRGLDKKVKTFHDNPKVKKYIQHEKQDILEPVKLVQYNVLQVDAKLTKENPCSVCNVYNVKAYSKGYKLLCDNCLYFSNHKYEEDTTYV